MRATPQDRHHTGHKQGCVASVPLTWVTDRSSHSVVASGNACNNLAGCKHGSAAPRVEALA